MHTPRLVDFVVLHTVLAYVMFSFLVRLSVYIYLNVYICVYIFVRVHTCNCMYVFLLNQSVLAHVMFGPLFSL